MLILIVNCISWQIDQLNFDKLGRFLFSKVECVVSKGIDAKELLRSTELDAVSQPIHNHHSPALPEVLRDNLEDSRFYWK